MKNYIKRFYEDLSEYYKNGKVLIIYGPRRVGKTTLLKTFLKNTELKYKLDSGDNIKIRLILSSQDFDKILSHVESYEIYVIDEAQQIKDIGMGLKIIVDNIPDIIVIATGSSSFELAQNIGEPLTGRKRTILLLPVSQAELLNKFNKSELKEKLEEFLVFGSFPEVITAKTKKEKIEILNEIVGSYLLKDILSFERIKSSEKIYNLLRLLAFQVGSEVSLNELSSQLKVDIKTVERYLDLLEKSFVIKKLEPFHYNLRKSIRKKSKYYFIDNGIRNGIITQFNSIRDRDDQGKLFENFIFMERFKRNIYKGFYGRMYFWRSYSGKEIDIVEEQDGKYSAFEIKYSSEKKLKLPNEWTESFPETSFKVINKKNYLDFLL